MSEHIDIVTNIEIKSYLLNSESRNKHSILKEVAIQRERTDLKEEKRKDDHMHSIRSPGKRQS